MAYPISEYTSRAMSALQRMADRLQWDPIDKVERLETMSLIINLATEHERALDDLRNRPPGEIIHAPQQATGEDLAQIMRNLAEEKRRLQ